MQFQAIKGRVWRRFIDRDPITPKKVSKPTTVAPTPDTPAPPPPKIAADKPATYVGQGAGGDRHIPTGDASGLTGCQTARLFMISQRATVENKGPNAVTDSTLDEPNDVELFNDLVAAGVKLPLDMTDKRIQRAIKRLDERYADDPKGLIEIAKAHGFASGVNWKGGARAALKRARSADLLESFASTALLGTPITQKNPPPKAVNEISPQLAAVLENVPLRWTEPCLGDLYRHLGHIYATDVDRLKEVARGVAPGLVGSVAWSGSPAIVTRNVLKKFAGRGVALQFVQAALAGAENLQ